MSLRVPVLEASRTPSLGGNGWVLRGVEDLPEGLVDLRAVGLGGRRNTAKCFPDFEGIDGNLDGHRGVRRVGGVDRGATMPARDLDGEVVAGLGAQPGTRGVDQEPARLRSEPVGPAIPMAAGYAGARTPAGAVAI